MPTSADTVTVLNGHTVTLDTTGLACLSGTVNSGGAVALSTSANSGLTSQQNFTFLSGSSCNFDLSAVPAIYSTIVTNGLANGTTRYGVVFNDGVTSIVCKGAPRKRVARLANAVTAGQVTFDVNDASGWRVGDVICVASTDAGYTLAKSEDRTVSGISGNTVTVSAGLTYGHQAGGYVGNMSSNLTFTSANSTGDTRTGYVQSNTSSAASPAASRLFQDVCFEKLGGNNVAPRTGSLELVVSGYPTSAYVGKGVLNCAFKDCFGHSLGANASTDGTAVAIDIDNNVATAIQITGGGCNFNFSGGGLYLTNPVYRAHVLRGFGNISALAGVAYGDTVFVDPVICGVNIPVGTPMTIRGGSIFACGNFAYTAKDIELYNVNLGTEFGANNGTVFAQRYSGRYAAYSCNFQSGGSLFANSSGAAVQKSSQVYLYDKNGDTAIQEVYSRQSLTVPIMQKATDQVANALNSLKCSSSSTINDEIIHTFPLLVSAGVAQTVFVNVRKNSLYGAATLPFISATKDGAVLATATMSSGTPADTWERLALTFTSPTSGQATITLQSQSANNGAVAWFSGIPIYPFIGNVRHYGYVFDETNAVRVANSVTVAPEATAIAYTGVTINTVTPQISVGAGTANTFQKVYDYIQAWAVQNIDKPVLLTSTDGNNFAIPLTCKVVWPSMGTDGTLAGGWLQLAAPGTHTYKLSGTKIEFQAAGAYNMSGTQFGGTVELVNTSGGAVTVSVPSGTSYTNTGPGITVTAPTVTQGLSFTGLLAGSEVFVFDSGTQTVLASTTNSGTTFNWSQTWAADVTVDYTVFKDGHLPIRVTGIVIGQSVATAPVGQVADRSYSPSSGLTFGSNATANVGTSRFGLTVPSTVQNWYSFMVESWRTQATLKNKAFPLSSNGPNSFALEGWEFSAGLNLLYRDGLRYTVAGVATAIYAAVYSVDTAAGMQVRFQQADGSATASAATTGKIDQLIQVYGDASHGSFDRRGFLALKIQRDGYDQAETDVVATYGMLDDQLYFVGLNPLPNGLPTGAPSINGAPSIVDHGASPVTWNSKQFSITLTDSAAGNTGEALMRWIRYNLGLGGTFQGKEAFNWHDLVQTSGTGFKTVRGMLYGDSGAALKGVRVVTSAGAPHPDFNLHTADDGSTFVPVFPAMATATVLANTRVQLFNVTTAAELDNQLVAGTTYSFVVSAGVSVGDTLRLRVCKMGYQSGEAIGLWTATGLTFLVSQPVDAVYNTLGIDGSTVTEFAGDVTGHVYIDANDLDGETTKTRLGAWYSWVLTTSLGISHFYGGITFLSPAEIRINVDVANILVENINASTALRFTDTDVRLFRSDGSSIIAPSSYSIHNDYSGVPDYSIISVGGANVITGDVADVLAAIPSAGTNASAVRTNLATELARIDVAVSSVSAGSAPSAATVAAAVRTELGTELARMDVAVSTRNATTPPTSAAIVAAVEASAVLAKEATVASRLAASSYESPPTAGQVASAVLAAAAAAPIAANVEAINGTEVTGAGVTGNEWGPA